MKRGLLPAVFAFVASLAACSAPQPLATVQQVDIDRFMGSWYVIAHIPTYPERGACNAIETYSRNADGTIATVYTDRKGGCDGKPRTLTARGFVEADSGNAIWGMQFLWPFKADYRIAWLDRDYSVTIVARLERDYVWIMARQPKIDPARYAELVRVVESLGYDTVELRKVPQQW